MRSLPFRYQGFELARIAGTEYVRGFWPVIAGVPLSGLVAVALAPNDVVRTFGFVCLLWPLTIPGRAAFVARKAARLYREETVAAIEEGELRLYRPSGKGSRLPLEEVRGVARHSGSLVARTRKLGFVAIPLEAFPDEDARSKFEAALARSQRGPGTPLSR